MGILRNVAKSDTFERQRQTINQIAQDIYSLGGGGSDLSTGLLRLGNGTRTEPSLSFVNDTSVGIYRPDTKKLAFVNDGKKLQQLQNEASLFYRNLILQKNILESEGLSITSKGQDYDEGSYEDIAAIGGTGQAGTLNLTVSGFDGTTTPGSGYSYTSGGLGGGGTESYQGVKLAGGNGSGIEVEVIHESGSFTSTVVSDYGSGYQINDVLTLPAPVTGATGTADSGGSTIVMSSNAGIFTGWTWTQTGGTATFDPPTDIDGNVEPILVQTVDDLGGTDIGINGTCTSTGTVTFSISPPWGTGGSGYAFTIDVLGVITAATVNQAGEGYSVGDTLGIYNLDLTAAIPYLVTTVQYTKPVFDATVPSGTFVAGQSYNFSQEDALNPGSFSNVAVVCQEVYDNGSEIVTATFTTVDTNASINQGDLFGSLEITEISSPSRFLIDLDEADAGTDPFLYPDLTLFVNNKYEFDWSNASSHPFRFSIHPDGIHNKYEETINVVEDSLTITVSDASTILVGMSVIKDTENSGLNDNGNIDGDVFVESINGNVLTLTSAVTTSGAMPTIIAGVKYEGSEVDYDDSNSKTTIAGNDSTPTTLYYYCEQHPNMAGLIGQRAELTIDPNNSKVFGSGFQLLVTSIVSTDNVTLDVSSGGVTALLVTTEDVQSTTATIPTIDVEQLNVDSAGKVNTEYILSSTSMKIETTGLLSPFNLKTAKVNFTTPGSTDLVNIEIFTDTGDVVTSGQFKTTGVFNSSDLLKIDGNKIEAQGTSDLLLDPAPNRVAIIGGTQALQIPAGNTAARPALGLTNDGAIRYNTQTTQYEGYSSATTSWSSLGGIRDLDGNTYITAEESVGANDDTFYIYNGNSNTLKITPTKFKFEELKQIASLNTSAPAYAEWFSNTPVTLGEYLKHRNNIYEVTGAGITATDGNAPTHTTGAQPNNTAELTFYTTAVGNLLFQEIDEVQIDPFGDTYLTVSGDLRLRNNVVSTDINDLILRPNAGKKVVVDATSTLVLPVGNENERGAAQTGSVRFNTTSLQYEGYDGNNWGSLGGVKDVDQNTYIIPETAPGANENILYFYNNGVNTIQLSTSSLDLTNIDSITSINNTSLGFEFKTLSADNGSTVLQNTSVDETFLYNTKQYFKFGMSAGLTVDPLIILEDNGDIFYNTGFGTGNETTLKVLNSSLTDFELKDYKVQTSTLELTKGTLDVGSALLYNTTTSKGCKLMVILENTISNKSSFMEFNVIDDGTEVYYNEYAGVNTSEDAATAVFDIDVDNNARITFTLTNDHTLNDNIKITVVAQILK